MEYRKLGASGLRVSVIGLGGNTFGRYADDRQTANIVSAALDTGINFFDTADIYNHGVSEEYLGAALAGRREGAIIATKVGMRWGDGPNESGSSRAHIMDSVHGSLRRLGSEYIDLLQIHAFDPETPLEETLAALNDLVRQGKVRYIGCSNYDAWRMTQALWISDRRGWASFVSAQPEYNLLNREVEQEVVPACLQFGVGLIPYFPLAAGVLTGKYKPGAPPPENTRGHNNPRFADRLQEDVLEAVQRLDAWAHERGHTVGELALAWLAARPAVATVIAGTRSPDQVIANAKAAEWKLTAEDMRAIDTIMGMGDASR